MTYGNVNGGLNDAEKRKSNVTVDFGNDVKKPADFETAITAAGYGKFHYLLLGAIILVAWAPSIDTSNISVIVPSAECDLQLTFFQKGVLNAAVYVGMVSSALFWGYLADVKGRKNILVYGFLADGICNVISGFSQNFWTLAGLKFASGLIISGPYATVMSYTAEFYRTQDRARILLIVGLLCLSGNIANTILAWLIIPQDWDLIFANGHFVYNSWRIFLSLCGVPTILGVVCLSFFPESPKFLMSKGRNEAALRVLRRIYSMNSGQPADLYPIHVLENELAESMNLASKSEKPKVQNGVHKPTFMDGIRQILPLFYRPNLARLILVICIQFSGMLAMNTLRLWQPQLFAILEKFSHTNETIREDGNPTFCEILDYSTSHPRNETTRITVTTDLRHCEKIIIDSSVYMQTTMVCASMIVAIIFAGLFVNLLGNKKLLCIFYTISMTCLVAINWSSSKMVTVALTCVFIGLTGSSVNLVIGIVVSLFPTQLRTMAVSLTMMLGRGGSIIGNLLFPVLLGYGCLAPITALACFNLLALAFAVFIPKPKDNVK